ncbi:DUF4232 domain-containing protein [Streptomyces sp. SID8379]|nr:DUF4232 domain-containing protein [Streptomyces sp. SID8379]
MRTARTVRRTRLATAAATVALAALSLTACDDGSGVKDEGASAPSSATVSPTASSSGDAKAGGTGSGSGSGKTETATTTGSNGTAGTNGTTKAPSATQPPASSHKTVTCEGSTTKTVAAPLTRPVNHMLLTVTNTGANTCYLYGYPAVRFGEAQSVPPVDEDSQPQAVVTLKPGESGYASVRLSAADGSGAHGYTAKSLAVYFHGRSGNESVGSGATPSLPAKGVYVDDSIEVTYWQQSMDSALSW